MMRLPAVISKIWIVSTIWPSVLAVLLALVLLGDGSDPARRLGAFDAAARRHRIPKLIAGFCAELLVQQIPFDQVAWSNFNAMMVNV